MTAHDRAHHKLLLQIAIGAAWTDGVLAPAEVAYLRQLLERYDLSRDPDLALLLHAPVPLWQTERWMAQYLADTTASERASALAAIANLLIADDRISDGEHRLLDDFYELMADIPAVPETAPTLVQSLGRFARTAMQTLHDLTTRHN